MVPPRRRRLRGIRLGGLEHGAAQALKRSSVVQLPVTPGSYQACGAVSLRPQVAVKPPRLKLHRSHLEVLNENWTT
jgi:hypothetical protein